jgi:hypothetical protein
MSKLITVAVFISLFAALAFAIHASGSTTDVVGKATEAPIDPTAAMERASHQLPVEQFDAH